MAYEPESGLVAGTDGDERVAAVIVDAPPVTECAQELGVPTFRFADDSSSAAPSGGIQTVWHGVDHPEGVAVANDGVVWCGGEEGQIYRAQLRDQPRELCRLPGRPLGFAIDPSGDAYCCVYLDACGLYRLSQNGDYVLVSAGTEERPVNTPNHPVLLASGDVLFSDSGDWGSENGCVYAVDRSGSTRVFDETCRSFPNGLALSADGRTLAIVESTLPGVSTLTVRSDGTAGSRTPVLMTPGMVPDGIAYDSRWGLLVSFWVPDAIIHVTADGDCTVIASDPFRFQLNQPTNIAFVPGTATVVVANIGERFLSVFEHSGPGPAFQSPDLAATSSR
jgi:sugar lactone lactonase YvrE